MASGAVRTINLNRHPRAGLDHERRDGGRQVTGFDSTGIRPDDVKVHDNGIVPVQYLSRVVRDAIGASDRERIRTAIDQESHQNSFGRGRQGASRRIARVVARKEPERRTSVKEGFYVRTLF